MTRGRLHPDPVFDGLLCDPGAADRAAVAAAARRLRSGDVAGWERFWRAEGDGALGRADDRLAVDDVPGARQALLAAAEAYGLAAHLLESEQEGHRGNRAAQIAAFRAAMPLMPGRAEMVATDAYLFGDVGAVCAVIPLPAGVPAEAGYARFAVPALARGVDCLVLGGSVRDLVVGTVDRCPAVVWRPPDVGVVGPASVSPPGGTSVDEAMTSIAAQVS